MQGFSFGCAGRRAKCACDLVQSERRIKALRVFVHQVFAGRAPKCARNLVQSERRIKALRVFVHQVFAGRAPKCACDLVQRERRIKALRVFVHQVFVAGAEFLHPRPPARHIKTVPAMNPFIADTTKHHFLFQLFGVRPRGAHLFAILHPAPTSGRFCPLPVPSGR